MKKRTIIIKGSNFAFDVNLIPSLEKWDRVVYIPHKNNRKVFFDSVEIYEDLNDCKITNKEDVRVVVSYDILYLYGYEVTKNNYSDEILEILETLDWISKNRISELLVIGSSDVFKSHSTRKYQEGYNLRLEYLLEVERLLSEFAKQKITSVKRLYTPLVVGAGFSTLTQNVEIFPSLFRVPTSLILIGEISLIDSEDLARIAISLINDNCKSNLFVAKGLTYTLEDLFERIAISGNQVIPYISFSEDILKLLYRLHDLKNKMFSRAKFPMSSLLKNTQNKKYEEKPENIDFKYKNLDDTIEDSYIWYRDKGIKIIKS